MIDKTLDRWIDSTNGDYIMKVIREDYLKDSTVTICIIGNHSSENEEYDQDGLMKNYFIIRELQASLFDGEGNTRNGILVVVIHEMYDKIYRGSYVCPNCGREHNYVNTNDDAVIKEFSMNYYIKPHEGCGWSEDEKYCILVKWDDFISDPETYINMDFEKRSAPIAKKITVRASR